MIGLRMFLLLTILTGIIYPVFMTTLSQWMFPNQASGSLLRIEGQIVGSELLAQRFTDAKYFWPRPSATNYNTLPSGASNLSLTSEVLKKQVEERQLALQNASDGKRVVPQDLLFASGSGVDPHITPQSALYQIQRVALARNLSVDQVRKLVLRFTERRQLGFLGEPRVNVLRLNLELDRLK